MRITALVPSAGVGKRFGQGIKKPFAAMMGKPILLHTVQRLQDIEAISEIIPILRHEDMEEGLKLFESAGIHKVRKIAAGGKERQDSVNNALKLVDEKTQYVLIHDGVRPLITGRLVTTAIQLIAVEKCDGVVLGVPVKDTIKEIMDDGTVKVTLNREPLWAIQTPQVFPYDVISHAYEKAYEDGFYATDDSALVERMGAKVKVIPGSYYNIKITTPEDLILVEALMDKII